MITIPTSQIVELAIKYKTTMAPFARFEEELIALNGNIDFDQQISNDIISNPFDQYIIDQSEQQRSNIGINHLDHPIIHLIDESIVEPLVRPTIQPMVDMTVNKIIDQSPILEIKRDKSEEYIMPQSAIKMEESEESNLLIKKMNINYQEQSSSIEVEYKSELDPFERELRKQLNRSNKVMN
jgi:hypothetical protein